MVRQLIGTRARRLLIGIAVAVGVLAAAGLQAVTPASDRTFAGLNNPVQSLISVVVPFYGVVVTTELRRSRPQAGLGPALATALLMAVGFAVVGLVASALVIAVAPSAAGPEQWARSGAVVVGSLVVQVVAQLVGTSLGLLIAPRWAAMFATVVLPLGLWFVLGAAAPLTAARGWLTPYEWVPTLLAGSMTAIDWLHELVVALLWGPVLLAVGWSRLRPRA